MILNFTGQGPRKIVNWDGEGGRVGCNIHIFVFYRVYKKKLYPLKLKLSAGFCVNLTALNASN